MENTIDDPLLGALVANRYRVHTCVSHSGMATVYTATDERLERTVVLKIIHPTQANDPSFVDRFIGEAGTIARLTHPNVVSVYDQGSHQGLAFLIMEAVRGQSLRDLISKRRRLEPQDALAITEQMLAAIAAAHRSGLVHRDVKPENVLVCEAPDEQTSLIDGVVKVADFGLARAVEASADGASHLMATAAYVAPELVSNGHADPRTDVYSAGIVLFEMLTGRVPYDGENLVDVAWRHVHEDVPPPSRFAPEIPPNVDALVIAATSRNPAARPTDAGAMLARVQQVREELGAAIAGQQMAAQQTMVVPRVQAGGLPPGQPGQAMPGMQQNPGMPMHGGEPDRPAWARLPQTGRPPQGRPQAPTPTTYHAQPGRRRQPDPQGQTAVVQRIKHDPKARVVALASLSVLALLAVVGIWWIGAGRYSTTPSLLNLPKDQAISIAKKSGFSIKLDTAAFDDKVAKDSVLSQKPKPGDQITSGGTITVVLSKGPERYQMQDYVGKSYSAVAAELEPLGVILKRTDVYDDNIPSGSVVATNPEAGSEFKRGATVEVKVSKGRAPITVPNVVDKQLSEAINILTKAGLTYAVQEQDSSKPKDQVINQDPVDGSGAEKGAKITLTISKGPPYVVVPEVRGKSVEDATKDLQALGLQVEVIGGGTVRIQDPQPNTQVQQGSKVRILAMG